MEKEFEPDNMHYIPYSRRQFVKTAVSGAVLASLAGCDISGDDPSYEGPEIDEADFVMQNALFYDANVNARTQFPHTALINGVPSGRTDPASIAFRLQYLIDQGDAGGSAIDTILNHLLLAQESSEAFLDYRGFITDMWFRDNSTGFQRVSPTFNLAPNAALSTRIAMAAQGFKGTEIETKALAFLNNQKEGYNFYLNDLSLFYPLTGTAISSEIDSNKIDLLFSEYYAEIAFCLSYFTGDSITIANADVGQQAWDALIETENIPTTSHTDSFTNLISLAAPLSRSGGAQQYFQSLNVLKLDGISDSLQIAMYNALYSYLDAARFAKLPGVFAAAPSPNGNFLTNNGLSRLASDRGRVGTEETVVAIDPLLPALRLFPDSTEALNFDRRTIRRWIGLYSNVEGISATFGLNSAVDKTGTVARDQYTIQTGSMILFNTNGPDLLEDFLSENEKTTLSDMFNRVEVIHEGVPIEKVDSLLPLPPPLDDLFDEAPVTEEVS